MDIWVNSTNEYYQRITEAFKMFGLPLFDMTRDRFLNTNEVDVFSFGRPPVSIDVITSLKGVEFDDASCLWRLILKY